MVQESSTVSSVVISDISDTSATDNGGYCRVINTSANDRIHRYEQRAARPTRRVIIDDESD
jgi:hypothetical protein